MLRRRWLRPWLSLVRTCTRPTKRRRAPPPTTKLVSSSQQLRVCARLESHGRGGFENLFQLGPQSQSVDFPGMSPDVKYAALRSRRSHHHHAQLFEIGYQPAVANPIQE